MATLIFATFGVIAIAILTTIGTAYVYRCMVGYKTWVAKR